MKKKIIKFITSFKIIIVLSLISLIYFAFIASSRYESTAIIGVKSTSTTTDTSSLIPIIGLTSSSKEDIMYLKEYINSYDMLAILQKDINIKAMYEGKIDYELFLKNLDIKEDFLKYYQSRIKVVYDDITGLLSIKINAFSPEDSKKIADTILKESENFINEISHKIAREQMSFAKEELEKASLELSKAQDEINKFQNTNSMLDPVSQAKTQSAIKTQIEEKIIAKEVELATLNSYLNSNTPQVKALKSELDALKSQLKKEANKLTSKDKNDKLNYLAIDFSNLSFKLKFAEDAYKLALASYEKSRLEANKKLKQVIIISSPVLSEIAIYPNVIYDVFSVFFILTLVFGIIKFTYSIIEEHRY
ncbi:capsule biosynthesis protein [Campylobacter sp. 2018MI01]|uniref:capsule biosynthesis protein n=1 Tax=Campylobacter sp. 2018MI01 TaxID=2836735 RepID=UPI001BDAB34D|nr:capsule biosynthesis protein [Campylobacter sp. 2018MI01]MBT0879434.1 capsule biosynthesis protein [Campylobacter sp. 2018MI01]